MSCYSKFEGLEDNLNPGFNIGETNGDKVKQENTKKSQNERNGQRGVSRYENRGLGSCVPLDD